MPAGKKITRKKPGSGPSNVYFTEETQKAIIAFKLTDSQKEREELYLNEIYPAFKALVESLINVYKFQVRHETKEELRTECLSFLYGVITKFNAEHGSKAFSYFNIVAKNWLTIRSKQNAKFTQNFSSLDDQSSFSAHDLEMIENYRVVAAPDEHITEEEQIENIKKVLAEVKEKAKTPNEIACMDAVNYLFESIDSLDLINKRATMIYIRNITNLSPKQLSIVLSSLKRYYKTVKEEQHQ